MKSPKYCTIYFVRHGQTDSNVAGLMDGHTNTPLNDAGVKQAKEVAAKLKHISFAAAFSSDLIRAHRTAEIIASEHQLIVNTSQMLRERNYGSLEGEVWQEVLEELNAKYTEKAALPEPEREKYRIAPGAENDEEILSRLITFLREIAISHAGKTVLVVSHGSIMRHFLVRLGFATYDKLMVAHINNTSYIKLRSDGIDFFVDETHGITLASTP